MLTVFFLNKEFINEHRGSSDSVLTVQNIMDWAGEWNSCVPDGIPKFKMVSFQNGKADIRIKLSGKSSAYCIS